MFVFSLKAANIKKILLIVLAAILILTGAFVLIKRGGESKSTVKNGMNLKAETAEERIAFLSQFGYEVTQDPLKVEEVIIPEEFDENYTQYNLSLIHI